MSFAVKLDESLSLAHVDTRFRLVLNAKTAKVLGLTIPEKVLALADEVIE